MKQIHLQNSQNLFTLQTFLEIHISLKPYLHKISLMLRAQLYYWLKFLSLDSTMAS